jgi:hypothetical protein
VKIDLVDPFELQHFYQTLHGNRMRPVALTGVHSPQNKVAPMGVLENAERVQAEGNAAGVRFVLIELDTGLLFCRLASCSDSERDARRNEANARRSRLNIVISALQRLGINRQYSAPELAWPYIY